MAAPNSVDFDELLKNFSDLVLKQYGKKLSDKDPIMLQFLMQEMFTKELSKRLSEYIALNTSKLEQTADLWDKREKESFSKLDKACEDSVASLKSVIDSNILQKIQQIFKDSKEDLNKSMKSNFSNLIVKVKQISLLNTIVCSFATLLIGTFIGKFLL